MFAHRTHLICINNKHELPARMCVIRFLKKVIIKYVNICHVGYLNSLNSAPPESFYVQVLDALFKVNIIPFCFDLANTWYISFAYCISRASRPATELAVHFGDMDGLNSLKEAIIIYLDRSGGLNKLIDDCKVFKGLFMKLDALLFN